MLILSIMFVFSPVIICNLGSQKTMVSILSPKFSSSFLILDFFLSDFRFPRSII